MTTTILGGLAVGAVYALVALGYSLSRVVSGALNFATAHLMMLAAFVGVAALEAGFPVVVAFLLAGLVGLIVGAIEERIAIRPLKDRHTDGELITTIGFSTVLIGVMVLFWGTELRAVRFSPEFGTPFDFLGGRVLPVDLVLIATAVLASLALWFWSTRTGSGLRSRAQTEDLEAAMLRGINVRVLSFAGFAICGAALGLLGPLIASKTFASAYLTNSIAIMAFVALTLGGIGSPLGALIGGLVLGLLQAFASWYFGALWANIVPFFLYLLILLLRPQGLLGRTRARAV